MAVISSDSNLIALMSRFRVDPVSGERIIAPWTKAMQQHGDSRPD